MLTGYWPPSNLMLRAFSTTMASKSTGWIGENWESRGYDIKSYYPVNPRGRGPIYRGDFQIDDEKTLADFNRITAELRPIAILSFGEGDGPWEIEVNAPDVRGNGPTLKNSLPFEDIKNRVNANGEIEAWVDANGNPGTLQCAYLSHLGAAYHDAHSEPSDPAWNIAQGFIHVDRGYHEDVYDRALKQTLRALTDHLNRKRGL
jgi:hypothetical protein